MLSAVFVSALTTRVVRRTPSKLLSQLETKLGLDSSVAPLDSAQKRSLTRVSPEAIAVAAHIVASDPHSFGELDAKELATAAEYAQTMSAVLKRARKRSSTMCN